MSHPFQHATISSHPFPHVTISSACLIHFNMSHPFQSPGSNNIFTSIPHAASNHISTPPSAATSLSFNIPHPFEHATSQQHTNSFEHSHREIESLSLQPDGVNLGQWTFQT